MKCAWCKQDIADGQETIETDFLRSGLAHLRCEIQTARRMVRWCRILAVVTVCAVIMMTLDRVSRSPLSHGFTFGALWLLVGEIWPFVALPLILWLQVMPWAKRMEEISSKRSGASDI